MRVVSYTPSRGLRGAGLAAGHGSGGAGEALPRQDPRRIAGGDIRWPRLHVSNEPPKQAAARMKQVNRSRAARAQKCSARLYWRIWETKWSASLNASSHVLVKVSGFDYQVRSVWVMACGSNRYAVPLASRAAEVVSIRRACWRWPRARPARRRCRARSGRFLPVRSRADRARTGRACRLTPGSGRTRN